MKKRLISAACLMATPNAFGYIADPFFLRISMDSGLTVMVLVGIGGLIAIRLLRREE